MTKVFSPDIKNGENVGKNVAALSADALGNHRNLIIKNPNIKQFYNWKCIAKGDRELIVIMNWLWLFKP